MFGRKRSFASLTGILVIGIIFFPGLPATWTAAAAESAPIKIGALLPLTGPLLHEGPKVKNGIELALDDAGWQVGGRKIELIVEDSATNPTTSLDKARKLVERDKVVAIIGPQHSGVVNAIQPYINKNKVINLKSMDFPKDLIAKYPYLIVLNGTHKQTTSTGGWYAYDKLGHRKVSTIGPDFIAGREKIAGFVEAFQERGGTVVQQQWYPITCVDFAPYLANLSEADALVAWVTGPGVMRLIPQFHDYKMAERMPMVAAFASSILDEDVLPQLGDKALGMYGASAYASTIDNPQNKRLVDTFMKKHGKRPNDCAVIGGYMNVYVLLEAIKAAGGETDPEKLRKTILGLKLKNTPIGSLSFTPEGAGILNILIIKVAKDGGEYFWQVADVYPDAQPR
ncbi:MAG: penicillin-binding protein activator [Pseudomonadota bacterium]